MDQLLSKIVVLFPDTNGPLCSTERQVAVDGGALRGKSVVVVVEVRSWCMFPDDLLQSITRVLQRKHSSIGPLSVHPIAGASWLAYTSGREGIT